MKRSVVLFVSLLAVMLIAMLSLSGCDIFGNTKKDEGASSCASGHDFGAYVSDENATCTKDGTETATCRNCGKTDTRSKAGTAFGHDLNYHYAKAATCTDKGWEEYVTCSRCDYNTYQETVPLGHHFDWIIDSQATKTSTGLKHEECTRCYQTRSMNTVIPVLDCDHESTLKTNAIAPTCTEAGKEAYWYCEICERYYSDAACRLQITVDIADYGFLDALNHSFTNYVSRGDATCVKDGHETAKCDRCNVTDTRVETGSALGHSLTRFNGQAATCLGKGWNVYENCSRCDYTTYQETAPLGHDYRWVIDSQATKTTTGLKHEECTRCYQTKNMNTVIPILSCNHGNAQISYRVAPTCTEAGKEVYWYCEDCEKYYSDAACQLQITVDIADYGILAALNHSFTYYVSDGDATCMKDGHETAKCDRCNVTDTRVETGSKTGHHFRWVVDTPATVTTPGLKHEICTGCTETRSLNTVIPVMNCVHGNAQYIARVAPICTEAGKEAYWYCPDCLKNFSDAACQLQITGNIANYGILSALNHRFRNYVSDGDATCLADGHETAKCDRCDATNTRVDVGSALWHNLVHHDGKAASCTENGWRPYETCSRCNYNTYQELAAPGHSFTYYVYNNDATCLADGTKTAVCDHCTEIDVLVVSGTKLGHGFTNYVYQEDATCLADGHETAKCDRCPVTDTRVKYGTALGHSFTNYVYNDDATCLADGTETAKCDRCIQTNTRVKSGSAPGHNLIHHDAKAQTCTEIGWAAYDTCSRCNYTTYREFSKLGHSFTNYIDDENATCLADGTKTAVCDHCTEIDVLVVSGTKLGHSFTNYVYQEDATCLADGHETAKCDRCPVTDTRVKYGTARGHSFTKYVYNDNAKCLTDGTETAKCDRCTVTHTRTKVDSARGHSFTNYVYNGNAKCLTDGTETAKCDRCTVTDTRVKAGTALDHRFTYYYSDNNATCMENGTETAKCDRCTVKDTRTVEDSIRDHVDVNSLCKWCKQHKPSDNLKYQLNSDNGSYSVVGLGTCTDTEIYLPSKYNNLPVTGIGYQAFYGCSKLTSITIPDSVTSIGNDTFYGCRNLTSITIPDSVTSIGYDAFRYCYKLIEVCNKSSLTVTAGSSENGYLGYYAKHIITDEKYSYLTNINGYILYDSITEAVLLGYTGTATSLTLPSQISGWDYYEIYQYAFYENSSLTSITIPSTVRGIGSNAFYECSNLATVTFSGTSQCASIGSYAFQGCPIVTATIPAMACSYIEESSLKYVVITSGETIGDYAFSDCSNLMSIAIPDSVTSIGYNAFRGCSSLNAVCITDLAKWCEIDFKYNDSNPLYYAHNLYINSTLATSITIPKTVTNIGKYAFSGCNLTSVTIPDSVTSIGGSAFSGCSSLQSMTLPFVGGSIKSAIDTYQYPFGYIFGGTSYTGGIKVDQHYYQNTWTYSGTYYIPSSLRSVTIRGGDILRDAFVNCFMLTSIKLPDSVTSIGDSAFSGCSSMTSITIPSTVKSVGDEAFKECFKLKTVTFSGTSQCESVGDSAFEGCCSLTSITIPNSVTSIGDSAFSDCRSLMSIAIPDSVTSIGNYAFSDCSLTRIKIPANVTSIGEYAFDECSSLNAVYITDLAKWCKISFKNYYSNPLYYAHNLYINGTLATSITIPASVTSIGGSSFSGCSSLTSITIPNGVTSIGDSAFSGCSSLKSITIPASVKSIGHSAFYECSNLATVTFSGTSRCESIGNWAFSSCSKLTSITIPKGVTSISYSAFVGCYKLIEVCNKSSLTITAGSWDNGYIGLYAKHIITDEKDSYLTNKDGYIFYDDGTDTYLLGYTGTSTSLTLPSQSPKGKNYEIYQYAFYENSSLTSITIPASVTSIGEYAFRYCYKLIEVCNKSSLTITTYGANYYSNGSIGYYAEHIIKDEANSYLTKKDGYLFYDDGTDAYLLDYSGTAISLTLPTQSPKGNNYEIYQYAFYKNSSLTSITIPASVTSIGDCAFFGCINLATVTFSGTSKCESIGYSAFFGCSNLTSITIPASVTSIGDCAFSGCINLATVTFSGTSKCESIGYSAFFGCINLMSIKIPSTVKSIGQEAFEDCHTLKTVTFSGTSKCESIGNWAFSGCSKLTSITIPDGVTSIGWYAFSGCSSLLSLTIPAGVTGIGDRAFEYCSKLTSITFAENSKCTSIGEYTFYCCSSLTSITIPDSVTSIGEYAFYNCSSLTSITIPEGVTSIGEYAFDGCSSLNAVYITDLAKWCGISFANYSSNPLYYAHNLYINGTLATSITIPASVTSIGGWAFEYCSKLTSITIPNSVTSIGNNAFSGCSSLTSITIPNSVTSIGGYAFYGCSSLNAVYITDVAKWCEINFSGSYSNPLSYAHNLYINGTLATSITIPASVTSIGTYAFSGCSKLTSITIPESVTSIGSGAFEDCSSLLNLTIPASVKSVGWYAFEDCSSLTSITFAENSKCTSIGGSAFNYCTKLTSITIPDGVTSIGYEAFYYCYNLTSITIPDGVTSIGDSSFRGCSSLTSITFKGTKAQWNAISKGSYWNDYTGSYTIHCTDGDMAKS